MIIVYEDRLETILKKTPKITITHEFCTNTLILP